MSTPDLRSTLAYLETLRAGIDQAVTALRPLVPFPSLDVRTTTVHVRALPPARVKKAAPAKKKANGPVARFARGELCDVVLAALRDGGKPLSCARVAHRVGRTVECTFSTLRKLINRRQVTKIGREYSLLKIAPKPAPELEKVWDGATKGPLPRPSGS